MVCSLHCRLESESGAQISVSQLSVSHVTRSPSVQFSDVTSCLLRSRPHSRNSAILPNMVVNGITWMLLLLRMCAAPRVSVPLGASVQRDGDREGEVLRLYARREERKVRLKCSQNLRRAKALGCVFSQSQNITVHKQTTYDGIFKWSQL